MTSAMMPVPPGCRHSLVIPAYNEEERIGRFFSGIDRFDGELIVVCDGTDATAQVVEEIARQRTDLTIRCLSYDRDIGKGGCVIAGLTAARAPLAGFCDADGSTEVREMERLFLFLSDHDGAIGSRRAQGSRIMVRQGPLRHISGTAFITFTRLLFGLPYSDTQCGAKVFKKSALERVLPQMVSTGFEFDVELLWRLRREGCRVAEVPIAWEDRAGSRVRLRDTLRMAFGLIRVRAGLVHP